MTSKTPSPRYRPSSLAGTTAAAAGVMRPSTLISSVTGMAGEATGSSRAAHSCRRILDDRRQPLTDPDAEGGHAVAGSAPAHLVRKRGQQARPRAAQRVAERDRAAVDVQPLLVDAELAGAGDDLRGEGLVQLDEVDVVYPQAGRRERLRRRVQRTDPHHRWIDSRDTEGDEAGE